MPKFRKKPVVIEAVQWTGNNHDEINEFVGLVNNPVAAKHAYTTNGDLIIKTLEGNMLALKSDWIIKGVNGEFYPCKNEIFLKTYDKVDG